MDILFWLLYFIVVVGGIIYYGLQVLFLLILVAFILFGATYSLYVLYKRLLKLR